jgi:hypothetical protein
VLWRRTHGLVALVLLTGALTVGAVGTSSPLAAETPPGTAFLNAVDVQDMGTFDRVTFHFQGLTCTDQSCTPAPNALPQILEAEYVSRPVVADPSGTVVDVAGEAVLKIVMSNASGVNLFLNPPVPTYTGPTRIEANLPNVVEVVETGDFEATLSWAIGLRSGAATATATVRTNPTRVEVDIPHVAAPVVLPPNFTG